MKGCFMEDVRFPVEAGQIMLFARAVGDPNPIYSDSEYAATTEVGETIAPPTFVMSAAQWDPQWMLRPKIGQPWFGSGKNPSGLIPSAPSGDDAGAADAGGDGAAGGKDTVKAVGSGLHAEQHFEYHRNLVAGDKLVANTRPGNSWVKEGRSGKLVFSESVTEYRDQVTGELVVTARSVGVATEGPKQQEKK
jgi:hypothetical protein